ncbi:hypothetical protein SUGI_0657440 [Cryptomeria japonica]|nr:hypothetical protein SUGI_0657440 [Cryptomeria japonica]
MKSKSIFNCFVAEKETRKLKSCQSEGRSDHLRKSSVMIESDYAGEIQGKAVRIVSYSHNTQSKKDKVRTSDQRSRVRIVVTDSTLSTGKSQNIMPQGGQHKGAVKKGETAISKPKKSPTNKSFNTPVDQETVACTCVPTVRRKKVATHSHKKKTVSATDRHPKQTEVHISSTPQATTSQQITQTVLEPTGPLNNLKTEEKKGCDQVILVTWVLLIMLCLLLNKWIAVSFTILCFYVLPNLKITAQCKIAEKKAIVQESYCQ